MWAALRTSSAPDQLVLSIDRPGHTTSVSMSFHPILVPITDAILLATSWASSPARGTQITSSPATPSIAALTSSSSWSRHSRGTPGLCIPAFSVAIFGRVSPRTSEWSIEMVVIAQMSASTSLVESSLPPRPVSMTALSTLLREKASIEARKVVSKYVGRISGSILPASLTSSRHASNSSALTGLPSILALSSTVTRCGEVYSPIRSPLIEPRAERWAQREPLPLVPATCMLGKSDCGLPSLSSISEQVDSPKRTPAPILESSQALMSATSLVGMAGSR